MSDEQNTEWRKLTFAQRAGEAPLPDALEVGKLSTKFRNNVWLCVSTSINGSYTHAWGGMSHNALRFLASKKGAFWNIFVHSYFKDILDIPHDRLPLTRDYFFGKLLRRCILEGSAGEVLTALECMLRVPGQSIMKYDLEQCFKDAPYFIDNSAEPVCIIATVSEESKTSVKRALEDLQAAEKTGATTHLRKSAMRLNAGEYGDSVRESIHAVASVARTIDSNSSTLGPALNALEKIGVLKHRVLKVAFQKLYGYTNDEQGIRHELLDNPEADVDHDDAIFMHGACASFAAYLANKYRKGKSK